MERLNSKQLKREQRQTLAASPMRYGFLARLLFFSMDLLYGRKKECQNSRCSKSSPVCRIRPGRTWR